MSTGRLKVIHVITRLIVGGAQENTLASVLGLRRQADLDVSLVAGPTHGPEGTLEPIAAATPDLLTLVPSLVRPVHPWHDTRALLALIRHFRRQQPDIVHTHSGKAGLLGRLAARHTRTPHIIHTIHGPSFGQFQGPLPNLLFRSAERWAGRYTSRFVVVAEAMRDQYLAAGIGRSGQYVVVYSGFQLDPYLHVQPNPELRHRLGLAPDAVVVGMIARLFALKGHDDLLEIAPQLCKTQPRLRFLLVGDGTWRPRLEQKASSLGIRDRVVFTGLVPPESVPSLVGLMDILVHLSRREGLPRALPQALAAARPVVAYDCDGAREICINNLTGYLVNVGDHRTLAQRILHLADDPDLRQALGKNGQRLVLERFTVDRMTDDLARLYRQLGTHPSKAPSPHPAPTH